MGYLASMFSNSLAGELISTFSPGERKGFALFLARPERKVRPELRQLGDLLLGGKNGNDAAATFAYLFPGRPFDRQRLNQLLSFLYREAKAFLTERHFADDRGTWLVEEFDRRGLARHRDRHIRRLEKRLERYADLFDLEWVRYHSDRAVNRKSTRGLQELDRLLDLDYRRMKLRQACLMVSHQNVADINYDYGILDTVLASITPELLAGEPVVAAYYHAYRFLSDPEAKEDFDRAQSVLLDQADRFVPEELRMLFLFSINFCIRRLNGGEIGMLERALQLYQKGLSEGFLLENNMISPATFRNAVAMALRGGQYEWSEQFIRDYADRLPADQKKSLVHLVNVRLAYARGDLAGAMTEMRYITPQDALSNLTLGIVKSKIYYELGEFDLLHSFLDSMKVLLWRKDDTYHRKVYRNFLALLQKTLHLPPGPSPARDEVVDTIRKEKILSEREWLLELATEKK